MASVFLFALLLDFSMLKCDHVGLVTRLSVKAVTISVRK